MGETQEFKRAQIGSNCEGKKKRKQHMICIAKQR